MRGNFKWISKIEEFDGERCHVFYLNDGVHCALPLANENYKDMLIRTYEEILFYTQISKTEFIDLRK